MGTKLKLIGSLGTPKRTGSVAVDVVNDDVDAALGRLFNKAFRSRGTVYGVRCWAWAPGCRQATFVGQTIDARPHYLSVSFSDDREVLPNYYQGECAYDACGANAGGWGDWSAGDESGVPTPPLHEAVECDVNPWPPEERQRLTAEFLEAAREAAAKSAKLRAEAAYMAALPD